LIAWVADVPNSKDKYLALFNTSNATASVPVELKEAGFSEQVKIRDLWTKKDAADTTNGQFAPDLPAHGAGLYRVSAVVNH